MKKLLLILFLFSIPVYGTTLSDIRDEVRIRIKDSGTSTRFSDAELNAVINEAQRDVINNTWAIQTTSNTELSIGTTFYSIPDGVIDIRRVTLNGRSLEETTVIALDSEFNGSAWFLTGGVPRRYHQASGVLIGLYPFPNSSSSTGTLSVFYFSAPTDLSNDSDEIFNGSGRLFIYGDLLTSYTCYRVYLLEGEIEKSTLSRQEYESRLLVMKNNVGKRPNYNPSLSGTRSTR